MLYKSELAQKIHAFLLDILAKMMGGSRAVGKGVRRTSCYGKEEPDP
jgi:hypothetical protein